MTNRIALCAVVAATVVSLSAAHADGIDPIALRQTGYDLNSGSFAHIRSVVAAKGDVKPLESSAKAIARWASIMPTLFPPGSDKGNTKALPAVWSDAEGFQKAAATLGAAATKLASAAAAGDADAVAADAKAVGDSCGACHRTYRAR